MKKYKKITTLIISLITINSFCCSVSAFKYINRDRDKFYDEDNKVKRKNIKTKSVKEQKGFTYSMSVKRPENAPGNYIDFFNKCFMYIFSKKTPYKEKEGINMNSFFRNCNYRYNDESFYSNQYVFNNSKKSLEDLKNFYKNNMADREFSKYFNEYDFGNKKYSYGDYNNNKTIFSEDEYKKFLNSYCNRLFERFKAFSYLLRRKYERRELDKLKKILELHYKDTSHSEDVLSFMNQSKNMRKLIKTMLEIVKHKQQKKQNRLLDKKRKKDKDYEDELFSDFSDDLYYNRYNSYDFFNDDYYLNKDEDEDDFNYKLKHVDNYSFKECLDTYYRLGIKDIQNLKSITFDKFKESVKSVDFKNNTESIVRKIEEVSGTVETLERN